MNFNLTHACVCASTRSWGVYVNLKTHCHFPSCSAHCLFCLSCSQTFTTFSLLLGRPLAFGAPPLAPSSLFAPPKSSNGDQNLFPSQRLQSEVSRKIYTIYIYIFDQNWTQIARWRRIAWDLSCLVVSEDFRGRRNSGTTVCIMESNNGSLKNPNSYQICTRIGKVADLCLEELYNKIFTLKIARIWLCLGRV